MKKFTTLLLVLALTLSTFLNVIPMGIFADSVIEITDNKGYSGGLRLKGDTSIMFSPYINDLNTLVNGGESLSNYTIDMTFTLLTGDGGTAKFTFDTVSASLTKSNYYFDVFLNGSGGNCGFCPTAGEYYDIYVEIYKGRTDTEKGTLAMYGTYTNKQAPTDSSESPYYKPTPAVPRITETKDGYDGDIVYTGIRRKGTPDAVLFSPHITEMKGKESNFGDYTVKLTFTLLSGKDGSKVHTFDTVNAKLSKSNGKYYDIFLQGAEVDCGFCPTAGKYYDIDVEIYDKDSTLLTYGTYKSILADNAISGSGYYSPTSYAVPQITETKDGYTGNITFNGEGIRKRSSGQISFCPYITELRALCDAGASPSDFTAKLTFTQLTEKDGEAVHTFETISLTPENGTGYFYLTLADSKGSYGFCPIAGEYYDIKVEIYDKDSKLLMQGTYKSIPAAAKIEESDYYSPTPKTQQITETKDTYTGTKFYGGGIRLNSKGKIMASAFITELRTAINAGKNYSQYTIKTVFTLLDDEGKEVVSFPEVTLKPQSSSGQYFDIPLDKSTFVPTAGKSYNISMEIYEDGVLKFYGTYKNILALDAIAGSDDYIPTPVPGAPVEYDITLGYSFNNTLAGSAAGKIFFTVDKAGYFEITWGDKDGKALTTTVGEKTLTYSELVKFNVTSDTGGSYAEKVLGFTAIPQGAETLIVLDSVGNVLKTLELPVDKLQPTDAYTFSFGAISDLHYEYFFTGGVDDAIYAVDTALAFYQAAGAKLVVATGDYSKYTEEAAYQKYQTAVNKVTIPVIACGGNHEVYTKSGEEMFGEGGYWLTYMNNGVYDGSMPGVLDIADNGVDFAYSYPGLEDYVYISLNQWKWDGHTASQDCLVTEGQLEWLAEMLEEYKDKTVYLLFHTYLGDDDYESIDGEGDMTNPGGYTYGSFYNKYTNDEKVFRNLLDKYENVIWFNGHSHYEYSIQKYNENLNIFDYMGTTATMIHVPSVTNARTITDSATNYSNTHGTMSQGALMFVYKDYQIMNGVDLWNEEILSYACYIVYDDKSGIVEDGTVEETEITWTWDAQLNSLRILGTGEMPDFTDESPAPWDEYLDDVMTVYVGKGVTSVGENAFKDAAKLETVELKNDVAKIGENAFAGTAISKLILPEGLKTVAANAFGGIASIDTIIFEGSKTTYGKIAIADGNDALNGEVTFRKYTVIWDVNGEKTSEEVKVGEQPVYEGLPAKDHEDPSKHYIFTGWSDGTNTYTSDKLPKVSADVTYTAVFGDVVDRYVTGFLADGAIVWTVDRTLGTLTISGSGAMPNWAADEARPWDLYKNDIVKVIVKTGITSVGSRAFNKMPALQTIVIEKGVTSIGMDAFAGNSNLTTITLPATLTSIGQGTVYQCENLKTVYGGFATAAEFEAIWSKLAYNTAYGSAQYYTTAITFAGHQLGNNSIRFVGTASKETLDSYDKIALKIEVAGRTFCVPTAMVYSTLKGNVNGSLVNVVTTAGSGADALFVLDVDYLYGLAIIGIPAGEYEFTITPVAYIGETEVYGKTVTLTVEIKDDVTENTENAPYYTLSETVVKVDTNGTYDIKEIATANANAKTITYVSSNPSVATVDENGIITGVSAGNAVITITATNETKSVTVTLTVVVKTPWTPDNAIDEEAYNALNNLPELRSFAWYSNFKVTSDAYKQYNIRNLTDSVKGPVEIWSNTLQIDFTIDKSELDITAVGTEFDIYFKEAGSEELGGYDKATIQCWSAYNADTYYIYRCKFVELASKMTEGKTYEMVIVVRSGASSLAYVKTQLTWTDSCASFVEYAATDDGITK